MMKFKEAIIGGLKVEVLSLKKETLVSSPLKKAIKR